MTQVQLEEDKCRKQESWFPADRRFEDIHLVFYGKPIMQALKHLSITKGWKMTLISVDNEAGVMKLERIASKPGVFTIVFTTSRKFQQPVIQRLANSSHALVSAIRYAYKISGAKKGQLQTFRAFFRKYGCRMKDKGIMPLSYMLDEAKECLDFFKYASLNPEMWWVLKPSQGYGGEGITIHTNLSVLHSKFALCDNQEQFIVQQYLPQLLLIEGRKFDVRGLVLIANANPYMLFYHEGYLRVSVEKFDGKGGRITHLTNSHIQTQARNYSPEKHFWSFSRFQRYLDAHHATNKNFVADKLVPFIKTVGLFILQAGICCCCCCFLVSRYLLFLSCNQVFVVVFIFKHVFVVVIAWCCCCFCCCCCCYAMFVYNDPIIVIQLVTVYIWTLTSFTSIKAELT